METKICNKCKLEFPAIVEYFKTQKGGKYGVSAACKKCLKLERDILYSSPEYKEKHKLYAREWRAKNPEKVKEINRKSYLKHGKSYNAARKEKYNSDPEYRNYCRQWDKNRKRNKEHFTTEQWKEELKKRRRYAYNLSQETKNKIKEYNHNYRLENHEYFLNRDRIRREELHDSFVSFILHRQTNISILEILKFPELITVKRNQLKLKRLCRIQNN